MAGHLQGGFRVKSGDKIKSSQGILWVDMPPEPPGHVPTFHGPQFGISKDRLRDAVNASCSCGGKPDTDPTACPACMVWHRLNH